MKNLETKYAGLELKNPVIIGASKLTANLDRIKLAEDNGAAAIVAPSIFEEQINLESYFQSEKLEELNNIDAEISRMFPEITHAGPEEHLYWLRKTKETVSIPVIGSINCVEADTWLKYAKLVEETGVDALELNFYHVPYSFDSEAIDIENEQIEITKKIVENAKIPVTVKLSYFYSNPLNFIKKIDATGIKGLVLFNRLFQPDVNQSKIEHFAPFKLSTGSEKGISLRYAGLLFGKGLNSDLALNTGYFFGEDVIKGLLMGGDAVQVVSSLIMNGIPYLKNIISDIDSWMAEHGYNSIEEFKGKLSKKNTLDPFVYKRAQYINLLFNSDKTFEDKLR